MQKMGRLLKTHSKATTNNYRNYSMEILQEGLFFVKWQ